MSTQSIPLPRPVRRTAAHWLLGSILAFGLLSAGDRSIWSAGAGSTGVDPLEILNLSVRANAIFVLDSSGSMGETLLGDNLPADHPDSKMAIAKQVINSVITSNQTKVSFQFGQYAQPGQTLPSGVVTTRDPANSRFQYVVADPVFTTEPAVQLRLFEVPVGSAWTVSFANGTTIYTTAALNPGTYTGTELAEHIAALMNAQHSASYTGSFLDPATSTSPGFTFTRGSGTLLFSLRFQVMDATLRGLLRAVSTESNVLASPFVIRPEVGSLTDVTVTTAGPNSFVVTGSPTIQIQRGASVFSGTLTAGTYTGSALATHIASRMNAIDTTAITTTVTNSFVITGSPTVVFRRTTTAGVNTTVTTTLINGTYTGDALAAHIAARVSSADAATDAQALYGGSYDETNGKFTFTRTGSFTTQTFQIRWASWTASLQTLMATPTTNITDSTSPYSLDTLGGLTLMTTNASYSGAYTSATGVFTFTQTVGTAASFSINWANWTAALRTLMGTPAANATDPTSPYSLATPGILVDTTTTGSTTLSSGPTNSTAPLALYRRSDSGSYEFSSGGKTYFSLYANKFFNGQTLSVLPDGTPCNLTGGTPTNPNPVVTIQRRTTCPGAVTDTVVFPLGGAANWVSGGGTSCGGYRSLVGLADCTATDQITGIGPLLERELATPSGFLPGYAETGAGLLTAQASVTGIRAAGATPIAESLIDIHTIFTVGLGAQPATPFVLPLPDVRAVWPVIAAQTKKQGTFVIFLTDGDDTCDNDAGANLGLTADENALRAAHKAERLYSRFVATEPASSVTTFVVALGSGASAARANWVAWGGSGMHIVDNVDGIANTADDALPTTRWSAIPTAAERTACTTCRDAFVATDAASLTQALQAAIDLGQSSGEFSDQQSITETVFEYVGLVPSPTPIASPSPTAQPSPYHPLNPITRYGSTLPVLLQSTFDLPEFTGHLKAFRNNAGVSEQLWDAGAKLKTRVVDDSGAMGMATYSFAALYGDGQTTPVKTSTARIKRRIFTTKRQGVLSGYTAQNLLTAATATLAGSGSADPTRVSIWPPAAGVAPTAAVTGATSDQGDLDAALGLLTPTTVAGVQALVGVACAPDSLGNNHPSCNSATASVKLAQARREAREVLLAFIAGAKANVPDGSPARDATTRELIFEARPWIMAESTLAAPAVVTPPLLSPTLTYKRAEYLLYRDGPRDSQNHAVNATANGLGLRNPDLENPQTTASRDNNSLKPSMSVIYHATNQALHALRAGPCPTTTLSGGLFAGGSLACSGETGGEELWAFVPFDQLSKLAQVAKIQSRVNKAYLLASPVRVTDVFVSGGASVTLGGVNVGVTGVWRSLAVFGRGVAGKSLTAIDVTVPGPFTSHSLDTSEPIVVWSRGNFDTTDGLVKTGSNAYVHDSADYNGYLGMGETWSVPAVGFVTPGDHPTSRRPSGIEFAMYMGSGYSDSSSEGKTFFVLDLLSGDVVRSFVLADGTTATTVSGAPLRNVLVASPAVYAIDDTGNSPAGFGFLSNPVEAKAKAVYFGDLHSRIWRYKVTTPAVAPVVVTALHGDGDQPFANPLSLLEVSKVPNLFFSGGRDARVATRASIPRFRMYGYSDATGSATPGPVTQLFFRDFGDRFRGNSAPAAAFTGGDTDNDPLTPPVYTPVVFYTGVASASLAGEPCTSSFNSVLFALNGANGLAAFDLNSTSNADVDDAFATIEGQVLQTPHVTAEGTIVLDRGLGAQVAPPPPSAPVTSALPPQSVTTNVIYAGLTPGTTAYATLRATTTPFRSGSAVCNVQ